MRTTAGRPIPIPKRIHRKCEVSTLTEMSQVLLHFGEARRLATAMNAMGSAASTMTEVIDRYGSNGEHKGLPDGTMEWFDEYTCRRVLGGHFNVDAWRLLPKDEAARVSKRTLLQHLGWPSEVFDGTSGTREDARAVNDAAEATAQGTPHFYDLNPSQAREARRASYVHSKSRYVISVENGGDTQDVSLTFAAWHPNKKTPARGIYLLFHGGGWVFGDAAGLNDERLEEMANALKVIVLVPEYRKAPEHPYPAALDDCEAAAAWCEKGHAHSLFGVISSTPLLIGGESAGGNLCAAVLLRRGRNFKSNGKPSIRTPWAFANLVYGIYDVNGTPSVERFGDRRLVETTKELQYFADCYCPDLQKRQTPEVSPLCASREEMKNFPEAAFTVGTEDALIDDTVLMFEKWKDSGNNATLDVWPEGPHGVGHFGVHAMTQLGRACRNKVHERIDAFLEKYGRYMRKL